MSVLYRSIFPVSQQSDYQQNQNIDFIMNLNNEKLVPGTIKLEGLCAIYRNKSTETGTVGYQEITYDPVSGYHSLVRDVTTEFEQLGIVESLQHYPRLVKAALLCTENMNSLGTETRNAVEGCCPTNKISSGLSEGIGGARLSKVPFSIKLHNIVNKMSAPVASAVTGEIRLRIRMASDDEFLWGQDYVSGTSGYKVTELKLSYQVIPDDGKRQDITMERYTSYVTNLDTNNQNISAFVPGLCDSVHMSFIKVTNQDNPNMNYNACEVPAGYPPLGMSPSTSTNVSEYGLERLYWAINDDESQLVAFTVESREELLRNGIRSFNPSLKNYNVLARRLRDQEYPDGYVVGIPFGQPIQLAQNKFAAEIQSQCSINNQYRCFCHFRCVESIQA